MRTFFQALLMCGILSSFPTLTRAEPHMEVTLEPLPVVGVGKACQFILQASWRSQDGDYRFSQPELTLKNLKVEDVGETNATFQKEGEEWRKKIFRFRLIALQPGKGRVYPFHINYVDASTGQGGRFDVKALEIRIVPDRSVFYRVILTLLAVMTGGGVVAGRLFSRARKRQSVSPPEATLEERYLLHLNAPDIQLSEVSMLFRSYLSEKYCLSQAGVTSREMIGKIEGKVNSEELKILRKIFDKLEEWRFGNYSRPFEEQQRLLLEMIRFVEGKKII